MDYEDITNQPGGEEGASDHLVPIKIMEYARQRASNANRANRLE